MLLVTLGGFMGLSCSSINTTVVISVLTICLAAMGTLVKVFGRKEDPEKISKLKDIIHAVQMEMATLVTKNDNIEKSMDELKKDYRYLTNKLDDLLKQLMDLLS